MINIFHKEQTIKLSSDIDVLKAQDKVYYIDASTGEIIGGKELRKEVF